MSSESITAESTITPEEVEQKATEMCAAIKWMGRLDESFAMNEFARAEMPQLEHVTADQWIRWSRLFEEKCA